MRLFAVLNYSVHVSESLQSGKRTLHLAMRLVILSMMTTFGTPKEFERDNKKISAYLEHVELYFAANEIRERQVPIFLSVIGAKAYSLL